MEMTIYIIFSVYYLFGNLGTSFKKGGLLQKMGLQILNQYFCFFIKEGGSQMRFPGSRWFNNIITLDNLEIPARFPEVPEDKYRFPH